MREIKELRRSAVQGVDGVKVGRALPKLLDSCQKLSLALGRRRQGLQDFQSGLCGLRRNKWNPIGLVEGKPPYEVLERLFLVNRNSPSRYILLISLLNRNNVALEDAGTKNRFPLP